MNLGHVIDDVLNHSVWEQEDAGSSLLALLAQAPEEGKEEGEKGRTGGDTGDHKFPASTERLSTILGMVPKHCSVWAQTKKTQILLCFM